MVFAHHANPAMRRSDVFEGMLEYIENINMTELQWMLNGCAQGPKISRGNSLRMYSMLLCTIGRLSLHKKFPAFWSKTADEWDRSFADYAAAVQMHATAQARTRAKTHVNQHTSACVHMQTSE